MIIEKEISLEKVLDKRLRTRYYEFINNGISTKSNLIHIDRKRSGAQKILDNMSGIRYDEFIKSRLWELACSSLIKGKILPAQKKFLTSWLV